MNKDELKPPSIAEMFDVDIRQSVHGLEDIREDMSAREAIESLERSGSAETVFALTHALHEIDQVIKIRRHQKGKEEELIDLFTAPQVLDMAQRIHNYLGADFDEFSKSDDKPAGYQFFVDRLSMYFQASDNSVTTRFSAFEERHTNPTPQARGPMEHNSRRYANYANEMIMKNLSTFYQTGFEITLKGPTKVINAAPVWDRGVAECQFLVLDYVAVQAAQGFEQRVRLPKSDITMTIAEIGDNIAGLLGKRGSIYTKTVSINPLLAEQIDTSISELGDFTKEVLFRGRWGTPRYEREPKDAQRRILAIEALLMQAISLEFVAAGQEEIPVLDLAAIFEDSDSD